MHDTARLIYTANVSLDGFIEDLSGDFGWTEPDEAVHRFINDCERPIGTYLYGRGLYETMRVWQTPDVVAGAPEFVRDYAGIWRAADKIVFSQSLDDVTTPRTRLMREFEPSFVRQLKLEASRDLSIGGATLAAHAFRADLIDECRLFVVPVSIGGGKPALPRGASLKFRLTGEHRFASGVVHLRYRVTPGD